MSYCEVDFQDASDEADPVEMYDEKVITARKPHVCTECDGAIQSGETCWRKSYKFEGKFTTEYVCSPCREAAGEFHCNYIGGMFWAMMRDEWEQGAHITACIQRLSSVRAKEHMRSQWLKWQERERQRKLKKATKADAVDPSVPPRESGPRA